MALNKNGIRIGWWMYDLTNQQLITSGTIPEGSIGDSKNIVLAEQQIPGLNYSPIQPGGNDNKSVSFSIPIIGRNRAVGNILLLKQFENLRNTASNLRDVFKGANQFTGNPKVLYHFGSGTSIPLEYYVKRCDMEHRSDQVNNVGYPTFSRINIELILDEESLLTKQEAVFRKISSYAGSIQGGIQAVRSIVDGGVNTE